MSASTMIKNNTKEPKQPFNWPVVGFLLLMIGIPGIPAIFIVALVLMGPSAIEGVSSLINATYFETPAAILVHASSGVLFFLSLPFQFSPALRAKGGRWHKTGGRIAILSGYVMGLSGIWMFHMLYPDAVYSASYFSVVIMSVAMCITFSIALWHIINRNVQAHSQWMVRAVAVTLAAITPLFLDIILYGPLENAFVMIRQFQHDYGRLVAIVVNLVIVEFIIFRQVKKQQSVNMEAKAATNT